jgi:hypothetical protein
MNQASTKKQGEWMELNQLFNQSPLTLRDFCKQHSINKHTFQYWRSKFRKAEKKSSSFRQIVPTNPKNESKQSLKLHFPGGKYLEIPDGYPKSELINLLQGLN